VYVSDWTARHLCYPFGVAAPAASPAQGARAYPGKPVHWIIPYAAGESPEEFSLLIKSKIQKWGKVVRNAGLQADWRPAGRIPAARQIIFQYKSARKFLPANHRP
jgi:hypothetical protein